MLETFDLPRMEPNCELRNASTVATQSLAMMNGDFTLTHVEVPRRAHSDAKDAGSDLRRADSKHAWKLAFGSEPSAMKT